MRTDPLPSFSSTLLQDLRRKGGTSGSSQPGNELSESSEWPHANTWTSLQGLESERSSLSRLRRFDPDDRAVNPSPLLFFLIYSQNCALWLEVMSDFNRFGAYFKTSGFCRSLDVTLKIFGELTEACMPASFSLP